MASFFEKRQIECDVTGGRRETFLRKIRKVNESIIRLVNLTVIKSLIFLLIFSITVPAVIYFLLIRNKIILGENWTTCSIDRSYRVPCGKANITMQECGEVHCCFDVNTKECFHYLPSQYAYRAATSKEDYYYEPSLYYSPFYRRNFENLFLTTDCDQEKFLSLTLRKSMIKTNKDDIKFPYRCDFDTIVNYDKLSVDVFRNFTGERLLTTSLGPLIASEYYWEWTVLLTTERLWGLGEIEFPKNTSTTKIIYKNKNDHNTVPTFMAYLNGSYHGLQIDTMAPLEVTVLPSYLIVLRALGGDYLRITVVSGPTPTDVVRQLYKSDVIYRPDYWSLGPHICREGATNISSMIKEYKEWRERTKDDIEYASDCLHDDLYLHLFDATDAEMKEIKDTLAEIQNYTQYLMSIPPMIPVSNTNIFNLSMSRRILYENETGGVLYGMYHGKVVVYPGYFDVPTWTNEWLKIIPVEHTDGYVLSNNWPSLENYTFVDDGTFPYLNDGLKRAFSGTIPYNSNSIFGNHLLFHNQYGFQQSLLFTTTLKAPDRVLPITMTSSFLYVNYVNVANVQNVNISWADLKRVYIMALSNSLFVSRLISIPVCGDTKHFDPKIHEKVCMRWYIMAASMPIFRISSDYPRRDPHSLPFRQAYQVAMDAIEKRRSLQPYYFSVLHTEHTFFAKPLIRPMFYEFYFDEKTFDNNEQYMVGDALLMAQPFSPGNTTLSIYLPPSVGIWYEFWGGKSYKKLGKVQIHVAETDWITFIAGGKIVPMRNHDGNSTNPDSLTLVIALNCTDAPSSCNASGIMYSNYYYATFIGNLTGVIVGNLNNNTKEDFGCYDNDTCKNCPNVIKTVKVYGLGDSANIFTKNVSLCTETEGDELYFIYK